MSKDNNNNDITRRQALKQMGGWALGSSGLLSALAAMPEKTEVSSPNIITDRNRASAKPNVLWITGEGVPISVLSSYQDTKWGDLRSNLIDTPNLDRLAREGMQFNNSFCTNALCAPSRASLLTGKYSHKNGVTGNVNATTGGHKSENNFDTSQQTFPKIFQRHGYQTAMMGKWHLQRANGEPANPGKAGFDKFAFKRGAGGPYYNPNGYLENPRIGSTIIEQKSHKGYVTDNFTDMALQTMQEFNGKNKPFLMMMQFFNDHGPFTPPHKYEDLFEGRRIPEPSTFWDDYRHRSSVAEEARMRVEYMPGRRLGGKPPNDLTGRQRKQWNYQRFLKRFLGTLKAQDDNIGRLLNYLDQSGLAENTIVVYTTDHGFYLGDHGWLDKRMMYEEAIRVPWIAKYPGVIEQGSTSEKMCINIDDAPTALDLAGLPIPKEMQGESRKPILQGHTPENWRTSMYYHYYEFHNPHWVAPNYGVRTDRYKLISYYTENQWELFDLKKDPDEMDSLFEWEGYDVRPGYKDVVPDLVEELKRLREKYDDTTGSFVHLVPTGRYN